MAIRIIIAIASLSIFACMFSCRSRVSDCNFENRFYKGMAVVFYHRPVSGATYQFLVFPLCRKISENDLQNETINNQLSLGFSIVAPSDDSKFNSVLQNAHKVNLTKRDSFGLQLQSIYYKVVYMEMHSNNLSGIENKTPENDEELQFVTGNSLTLKYKTQTDFVIDSLKILPNQ